MQHVPIIAVELVLVLGGTIAFYLWQMRDLKRQRETREAAEREAASNKPGSSDRPS